MQHAAPETSGSVKGLRIPKMPVRCQSAIPLTHSQNGSTFARFHAEICKALFGTIMIAKIQTTGQNINTKENEKSN